VSARGQAAAVALVTAALGFHAQSCATEAPTEATSVQPQDPAPDAHVGGAGGGSETAGPVDLCPSSSCPLPYADCNQDLADGCEVNLESDVESCGACGYVCPVSADGYPPECVAGECEPYCTSGEICGEAVAFGNCDGDPLDGCETLLTSDPDHCGSCGNACPTGVPCVRGHCGCIGDEVPCGDTCADLAADPMHCGGCGNACPDPDLGDDRLPRCQAGVCTLGCQEQCGLLDCEPGAPCVDVAWSAQHCGACGHTCPEGVACNLGVCCDGATLQTDAENCGACGRRCWDVIWERIWSTIGDFADGSFVALCESGDCAAECLAPWIDCNGDLNQTVTDGCETNGARDAHNCGGCGIECLPGQLCLFGTCATEPCEEVPK